MDRTKPTLLSGGHKGTEAEFGRCAERFGLREVTVSFEGHQMERGGGEVRVLSAKELAKGDVSMEIVSRHMGRSYTQIELIRRVIQSMYHVVVNAYQVFAVGWIQPDNTVQGGTGWGVELAKLFNRAVSVFDQSRNGWFTWQNGQWLPDTPTLGEKPFAATGTRNLTDAGRAAIADLFFRSFGAAPARKPEPAKTPGVRKPAPKRAAGRPSAKTTARHKPAAKADKPRARR